MLSTLLCWSTWFLVFPFCYLEYRGLRYIRETMAYRGFNYVMASLGIYLAPLLLAGLIIGVLARILLDGGWTWLGETSYVTETLEWEVGVFFGLLATWPFFFGYGVVGLIIWILGYREMRLDPAESSPAS